MRGLRTVPRALVLASATLLLAGCADSAVPGRAPDVSGVVGTEAAFGPGPSLVAASDDYYEGMALVTEGTVVVDEDGGEIDPAALRDGVEVEVWTGGACAESFPVQCGVEVVRVVG
jgi:hypothetical protein